MCKHLDLYPCGKCYSELAAKRNGLVIRLMEHYRGYQRCYTPGAYAILFGMLTYDNERIPQYYKDKLVKFDWSRSVQLFIKRFRKLYPFLVFEYFIGAEFGGNKTKRFHLHPIFFVRPVDNFHELNYKGTLYERWRECLMALCDEHTYKYNPLRRTSPDSDNLTLNGFEYYVQQLISSTLSYRIVGSRRLPCIKYGLWDYGLCDLKPVVSTKAIKYITKYILKTRDERFKRTSYFIPKRKVGDVVPFYNYGFVDKLQKREIYKSYLISNGIGNYYFDTDFFRNQFSNFAIRTKVCTIHTSLTSEVTLPLDFTDELRYSDIDNLGIEQKNSYNLPLYYRTKFYNFIDSDKTSLMRYHLGIINCFKFRFGYFMYLIKLAYDNNISFNFDYQYDSNFRVITKFNFESNMEKLRELHLRNYTNNINFKCRIYGDDFVKFIKS